MSRQFFFVVHGASFGFGLLAGQNKKGKIINVAAWTKPSWMQELSTWTLMKAISSCTADHVVFERSRC